MDPGFFVFCYHVSMRPNVLIFVLASIAFLGAATYIAVTQSGQENTPGATSTPTPTPSGTPVGEVVGTASPSAASSPSPSASEAAQAAYYQSEGTNEQIAAAAAKGPVVLFFHAAWCPTCQAADRDIRNNLRDLKDGVQVLRLNYGNSAGDHPRAKEYGITYQHTFVQVDATGKLIQKWNGGGVDELNRYLQN